MKVKALGIFVISMTLAFSSVTFAETGAASKIVDPKLKFLTNLDPSFANRNIYFEFHDSKKMTTVVREVLANHGYRMVDTLDQADVKIEIAGGYSITGAGKEDIKGTLGAALENSLRIDPSASASATHQSVDVVQIAAASIGTGTIDLSGMVLWVTQKTGMAGRFNQALTGDPRGFCLNENCNKYRNVLNVLVRVLEKRVSWKEDPQLKRGIWLVEAVVFDEKVVLDLMISKAMETALAPLLELMVTGEKATADGAP